MKKRYLLLIMFLLLLAYLLLWPVAIDPLAWTAPTAPALEGKYQENKKLANTELMFDGECLHCEDIAIDAVGRVYGSSEKGEIIRFDLEKGTKEFLVNTGGRPLGLHFDILGNLIIADAKKGLLSLSPQNKLSVLTNKFEDDTFMFADDLEVADDGMIYFSNACSKFSYENYIMSVMEHRPSAGVFSYNPSTKKTEKLLDGLYFANGIATSPDSNFILINETTAYRVIKYWLKGSKKGQSEVIIDNLNGFPDGISRGENGVYWIALSSPRKPDLDQLLENPFLMKIVARLPQFLQPAPTLSSLVLGINADGEVIYNLQDSAGKFTAIASVQQHGEYLYFGSLLENGLARYRLEK